LVPSLAIILVFNTSNGFPAILPIAPEIDPAKNFYRKVALPVISLTGSYNPNLKLVYTLSLSHAA